MINAVETPRRSSGRHATPVRFRLPTARRESTPLGAPVLTLPGAAAHFCSALTCLSEGVKSCDSHGPPPGRCSGFLTQPERCDVTLVSTLPLSGIGLRQTAGSFASRSADDHARQGGQRFRLATGSILTGQSWCNYCGGGRIHCLSSRSHSRSQAHLGFLAAETLRRN